MQYQFELDPHDKDTIFLFCGRKNDRIKALLWEGLPLTGIEAQTSGLPIVMSDVIADETVVTDNVTRLSLSNSADVWAKTCLDVLGTYERKDCQKQVTDAGFDVCNTAKLLQDFYIDRTLRARHAQKNL